MALLIKKKEEDSVDRFGELYQIRWSSDAKELVREVEKMLKKGWALQGGVAAVGAPYGNGTKIVYSQTMVRQAKK
jgi:hypothetical protein